MKLTILVAIAFGLSARPSCATTAVEIEPVDAFVLQQPCTATTECFLQSSGCNLKAVNTAHHLTPAELRKRGGFICRGYVHPGVAKAVCLNHLCRVRWKYSAREAAINAAAKAAAKK